MRIGIMAFEGLEDTLNLAELNESETLSFKLVSVEHDPELQGMHESEALTAALTDEVTQTVEKSSSLEAMSDALSRSLAVEELSLHAVHFANLAIESMGYSSRRLAISTEAYKQNPKHAIQVAIEDLREKASSLWSSVKEKMGSLAQALGAKLGLFKSSIEVLKKRVVEARTLLGTAKSQHKEARLNVLKPQDWFVDLCYLGKAAPTGLVGTGKLVEQLLDQSSTLIVRTVNDYIDWVKKNHDKALTDPEVFKTLKFKRSSFLMLDQKVFTPGRNIGLAKVSAGCEFNRSHELPGGMALYAHLYHSDVEGADSVQAIGEVSYSIAAFDPFAYSRIKMAILAVIGIPLMAYVSQIVGLGIAAAGAETMASGGLAAGAIAVVGDGMGASASFKSATDALLSLAKQKDAGGNHFGSSVKIEKHMVFRTLTLAQAEKVLADVESGIAAMHKWQSVAMKEVWADQAYADLVDKTINRKETGDGVNRTAVRVLKQLLFAVVKLQVSVSSNTMTYALRTYNSMVNYVMKSMYQYS